jgi:fructose-bisphosphate aldolase, class I
MATNEDKMKENLLLGKKDLCVLAYDQGFEHGPIEFDEKNVDPEYILNIARQSGFDAVILHEGIAAKYWQKDKDVPLIVKLNGKTAFRAGEEPFSPQLCTVSKAYELGASAVGYTIYVGSGREAEMMKEFSTLEDEAHKLGMVVIAWMYPRGATVAGKENDKETLAYAARLGLEMNADYVKIPSAKSFEDMQWIVKAAGRTGVLVQGGKQRDNQLFLDDMKMAMKSGVSGVAVGRNIWKNSDPIGLSKALLEIVRNKHV